MRLYGTQALLEVHLRISLAQLPCGLFWALSCCTFLPYVFLLQAQWELGRTCVPTQAFGIFLRIPDQDSAPLAHLRMSGYHSYGLHCAVIAFLNHLAQMCNVLHHLQVKPQTLEFPCLSYHLFALTWHLLSLARTLCNNMNPRVRQIFPLLSKFFCYGSSFISCSWLRYVYFLCEARRVWYTQVNPLTISG